MCITSLTIHRDGDDLEVLNIGVGDGGAGVAVTRPLPQFWGKYFSGKCHEKFGHFPFWQISCKIWEFCFFSGKYRKLRAFC